MNEQEKFEQAIRLITHEYLLATKRHGKFNSTHEGFAVLKEEVDELWDLVRKGHRYNAMQQEHCFTSEAKQIAAMAIRFIVDFGRI